MKTVLVCFLILFSTVVYGGVHSYKCTIVTASALERDGSLIIDTEHLKSQIGVTFDVDRQSGTILGGPGENLSYKTKEVIYSPENAFHAVSKSHGPNIFVVYLHVQEWMDGAKKPFVLQNSGYLYSGFCE